MPTGIGTGLLLSSIIGAGSSLAGGYLSNKQKQTSTPTYTPQAASLNDMVTQSIMQRLKSDPNLTGYTAQGLQDINKTFDTTRQSQEDMLTARGLATSPVAATVDTTRDLARTGAVAQFKNSIPLLSRALQQEDIGTAMQAIGLGRGGTIEGQYGGGLGGAFENLAGYVGYLQGKGVFSKNQQQGGAAAPAPYWASY